jgi:hypothetical protein
MRLSIIAGGAPKIRHKSADYFYIYLQYLMNCAYRAIGEITVLSLAAALVVSGAAWAGPLDPDKFAGAIALGAESPFDGDDHGCAVPTPLAGLEFVENALVALLPQVEWLGAFSCSACCRRPYAR